MMSVASGRGKALADDNNETREQKRQRQSTEIHAALGRYVDAFEQLVHAIRGGCIMLTGHNPKRQQLMSIIFNYHTMTAEPLFNIFRAIVGQMLKDRDAQVAADERAAILGALKTFARDYQTAIKTRNDYLHGTWFIGWGSAETEDFSEIGFTKFRVRSEGLAPVSGPKSAQEIDALAVECRRLQDYFYGFYAALTWPTGSRVARNLIPEKEAGETRWTPVLLEDVSH